MKTKQQILLVILIAFAIILVITTPRGANPFKIRDLNQMEFSEEAKFNHSHLGKDSHDPFTCTSKECLDKTLLESIYYKLN